MNPVLFSSVRQDWGTPQAFIDSLGIDFDLDVCAKPDTAKASRFFTEDDDALIQDWVATNAWMNPPFGHGGKNQRLFVSKAIEEIKKGHLKRITILIPARTDTRLFHELIIPNASSVKFIKGRLCFTQPDTPPAAAGFPSMLITLDRDVRGLVFGTMTPTREERGW